MGRVRSRLRRRFWPDVDGNVACLRRAPIGRIIRAAASGARSETGGRAAGCLVRRSGLMACAVSARQRFKDCRCAALSFSPTCNVQLYGMLSDLSFDDYLEAGGWRVYAQRAAKDAFTTEARSWLERLQEMLNAEHKRLLTLENAMADDLLLVVAIKRQLSALKRYLSRSRSGTLSDQVGCSSPSSSRKKVPRMHSQRVSNAGRKHK